MTQPKWYATALRNKEFYTSPEYTALLEDGISEYNKALADGNTKQIERWKGFVLKWTSKAAMNSYMTV